MIVHRYPDLQPERIVEVLMADLGWLEVFVDALYGHTEVSAK